jgi:hypothetical protein
LNYNSLSIKAKTYIGYNLLYKFLLIKKLKETNFIIMCLNTLSKRQIRKQTENASIINSAGTERAIHRAILISESLAKILLISIIAEKYLIRNVV